MSFTDLEALKAQAMRLGFSCEDVGKFVLQQQALEREERAAEHRERKEEEERKPRLAKLEAEKGKARVEAEKEIELARITAQCTPARSSPGESVSKPRLPQYKDGEDIVSYLVRFERVTNLLKVNESSYAVHLASLLTGNAADIYNSLPLEITASFALLK